MAATLEKQENLSQIRGYRTGSTGLRKHLTEETPSSKRFGGQRPSQLRRCTSEDRTENSSKDSTVMKEPVLVQ